MESQDIETVLRSEVRRNGERWGHEFKNMSDERRVEYLGKLLARRMIKEESDRRYSKMRPEMEEDVYQGDPEIMMTKGALGNGTGGGRRNIRGTKSLS